MEDLNQTLTNRQETSDEITRWLEHDGHAQTDAICSSLERLVELVVRRKRVLHPVVKLCEICKIDFANSIFKTFVMNFSSDTLNFR